MSHQPTEWASKQPRGDAGGSEPEVLKGAGEAVSTSETWVQPPFIRHRWMQRMTFICRVPRVRERNQRLWGGGGGCAQVENGFWSTESSLRVTVRARGGQRMLSCGLSSLELTSQPVGGSGRDEDCSLPRGQVVSEPLESQGLGISVLLLSSPQRAPQPQVGRCSS